MCETGDGLKRGMDLQSVHTILCSAPSKAHILVTFQAVGPVLQDGEP